MSAVLRMTVGVPNVSFSKHIHLLESIRISILLENAFHMRGEETPLSIILIDKKLIYACCLIELYHMFCLLKNSLMLVYLLLKHPNAQGRACSGNPKHNVWRTQISISLQIDMQVVKSTTLQQAKERALNQNPSFSTITKAFEQVTYFFRTRITYILHRRHPLKTKC